MLKIESVRGLAALRVATFGIAVLAQAALAAPFTPGNVVVYRTGTGTGTLVATGNAVFLDEYNASGMRVQTIALPTAAAGAQRALVASGTATTDGLMTRSADGTCLIVPGYGRDLGTGTGNLATTGTQAGGAAIPRIVGRVAATGAIDTSTALTDASLQSNFRGATSSDCTTLWVSGTAATSGGGVRATTLGATTSVDLTSGSFANTRAVVALGGQLYVGASVTALRTVASVGSGLPTSGAQSVSALPGLPAPAANGQPYQFIFLQLDASSLGADTLYIADESFGVQKFSLVAGTWVANGAVGTGTDAYRGITGSVAGGIATLYAVRKGGSTATGGGEIASIIDASGFNGTLVAAPTLVATAAANTAFRGIAMAPELVVTPSAGANGTISPATPQIVGAGQAASFTVTPDAGYSAVVAGTCGGSISGNTFTTDPVTASCTVLATFAQVTTYTVTPIAGANGSINPSTPRTLQAGDTTSFTITPNPGYSASVSSNCPGSYASGVFTTGPINADCSVEATFTLVTYTVTPSAGANGSISPSTPQSVALGTTKTFDVIPAHGFSANVGGTCGGSLSGTQYTTAPVNADCSVDATFAPLPTYTVTLSVGANGTATPNGSLTVISGDTASIAVTPAAGYNAAVRGTCGGNWSGTDWVTLPVTGNCTLTVVFARKLVLFVGNSYTFGRVDPVMSYNTAHVTDLTYAMWIANPSGSNVDEPHPWGGIPGVFKKMIDQAGLDWDVSISARNAATLRGHYLNSNPAGWDLRGNVASQRFDTVMLQDQSDEPLPFGRGSNANLPYFNAYVDKLEAWAHQGNAETYTESQLYGGSTAACQATTHASASACDTVRVVTPANTNARAATKVYLYQTWARPDMIGPNGTDADGQFYNAAEGIEAMTQDLHDAYFNRAAANTNIAGVSAVGDAFLRAVQDGYAMRDPYVVEAGKIDLWHTDYFHPSKYGSYLSALVHFHKLTGINPLTLGANEQAAADLGIAPDIAVKLQKTAQSTVAPDLTAPVSTVTASPAGNNGVWRDDVTVTFTAVDEANGSDVDSISYTLSGAQTGSGTVASGGSVTITAEGFTTVTWFAVDRAGNAEAPHTITGQIDRTPLAQAIDFQQPPDIAYDATLARPLSATGGASGNPVTFSSLTPQVCSVAGSSVMTVGVGACSIQADQAAAAGYAAATPVVRTFNVTKGAQSVTFPQVPPLVVGDADFAMSASGTPSSSGLTYVSMTPATCAANGSLLHVLHAGACVIRAQLPETALYNAAATDMGLTIGKGTPTFPAPPSLNPHVGDTILASASPSQSSAPLAYADQSGGCHAFQVTPTATAIRFTAAGSCTISVSQAGDGDWLAPTPLAWIIPVQAAVVDAKAEPRSDFNGDGKADMAWQRVDGTTALWTMNGPTQTGGGLLFGAGSGWTMKLLGDLDGDGHADILWQHTDGRTAAWLMNGATQSGGAVLLPASTGWSPVLLGDFNGDGKADIVWQKNDGSIGLWLMNGTTQIGGGVLFGGGSGWTPRFAADFNGDGKSDLLWEHTDGRTAMWIMNGATQVGGAVLLPAGTGYSARLTGDFNADGRADIVWQHTDGRTAMWLMNGTAQLGGASLLGAGTGWHVTRVGDLNGDGRTDLIWRNDDGTVAVWLMNGAAQVGGGVVVPAGSGWTVRKVADFNGDGMADIVMEDLNGVIAMWVMNGISSTMTPLIGAPNTGWLVAP